MCMKVDKEKLKKASTLDILQDLKTVEKEFSDITISWARTKELLEYKNELLKELNTRE